jgi:hypothetical protein
VNIVGLEVLGGDAARLTGSAFGIAINIKKSIWISMDSTAHKDEANRISSFCVMDQRRAWPNDLVVWMR